ncbi:hypothetical protein GUJ93_ZPchr0010g7324 [Zizania palustris]|uniref:Uncharacterized protein n=1 Tax=Zizania palustris TaxID=103762 RepID=A0A8J5WDC1_ZIZPA|nr:hypothetical protein GUJ93_ZPchr0010g7324 [Zizania palustris]
MGLGHGEAMGMRRAGDNGATTPVEAMGARRRRRQRGFGASEGIDGAAQAGATRPTMVLMAVVRRQGGMRYEGEPGEI